MSVVTSPSKEGLISFGKLSKRSTLVISLLSLFLILTCTCTVSPRFNFSLLNVLNIWMT